METDTFLIDLEFQRSKIWKASHCGLIAARDLALDRLEKLTHVVEDAKNEPGKLTSLLQDTHYFYQPVEPSLAVEDNFNELQRLSCWSSISALLWEEDCGLLLCTVVTVVNFIFVRNLFLRLLKSRADNRMTSQFIQNPESIFDLSVKDARGHEVDLSTYKGKVLLIVNVASKCGMTNSNYIELSQLYDKYKDQGLEILAFPCNQFGEEEPGSNDQIADFVCTRFKSEFPIFEKIDVNGEHASPLYKLLKSGKWGIFGDDIQWNFAKFLVDKNGQVVDRYYPTTSPLSLEHDIKKLLGLS